MENESPAIFDIAGLLWANGRAANNLTSFTVSLKKKNISPIISL